MRKVAFALFVLLAGCNDDKVAKLEKQVQQLEAAQTAHNLDLQAKCSQAASAYFNDKWGGRDKDTLVLDFVNHYSAKRNKCFIQVQYNYSVDLDIKDMEAWYQTLNVYDVFEKFQYGDFVWFHVSSKGQESRKAPNTCEVAGTKCTSLEEFQRLTAPYMLDDSK